MMVMTMITKVVTVMMTKSVTVSRSRENVFLFRLRVERTVTDVACCDWSKKIIKLMLYIYCI